MNAISIILLLLVIAAFLAAARYLHRGGGRKSCCNGCDGRCGNDVGNCKHPFDSCNGSAS